MIGGASIGANNAEATNAVSKQDFRAKSYIALKEARESLYWIELLHRNGYLVPIGVISVARNIQTLVGENANWRFFVPISVRIAKKENNSCNYIRKTLSLQEKWIHGIWYL